MHLFPVRTFKCMAVWFNTMIISFLLMQQSQLQYLNLWDLFIHIHQVAKSFITTVFSERDVFRFILNFNAKIYCIGNLCQIYHLLLSQFRIVYSFHILLCLAQSTKHFYWDIQLSGYWDPQLFHCYPFTDELLRVFVSPSHAEHRVKKCHILNKKTKTQTTTEH